MNSITLDCGIKVSSTPEGAGFLSHFKEIINQEKSRRKVWYDELRMEGVVLVHPNDGWVDELSGFPNDIGFTAWIVDKIQESR